MKRARYDDCTEYDRVFYGLRACIRAIAPGPDDGVGWDSFLITARQMVECGRVDEAIDYIEQLSADYPDLCFDSFVYIRDTDEMIAERNRILEGASREIRKSDERMRYQIIQNLRKMGQG
jgi:hypothetical protein